MQALNCSPHSTKEKFMSGTLQKGRRNVSGNLTINNPRRRKRGYKQRIMSGPILALSWLDNKPVYVQSTTRKPHYSLGISEENAVVKQRGGARGVDVACPPLLHDYDIRMSEIDFNDQPRKFYSLGKRSYRWYSCAFLYMLKVALYNSHILVIRVLSSNSGPLQMRYVCDSVDGSYS